MGISAFMRNNPIDGVGNCQFLIVDLKSSLAVVGGYDPYIVLLGDVFF
jgi:hypothetical protein